MANDNTPTVDPAKIRSVAAVELKEIPGFEAIMAEVAMQNKVDHKDNNDRDNREGDNNHMNNGEQWLILVDSVGVKESIFPGSPTSNAHIEVYIYKVLEGAQPTGLIR